MVFYKEMWFWLLIIGIILLFGVIFLAPVLGAILYYIVILLGIILIIAGIVALIKSIPNMNPNYCY